MTDRMAREHAASEPHARAGFHRPLLGVLLVSAVLLVLVIGALGLPTENAPLPEIARHAIDIALPKWGQDEVVSEIVYGSRGFDTFGETFLLLAAVVAVATLSRAREPRSEYVGEASAGRRSQQALDPAESADPAEQQARSAEREEESEDSPPAAADADTAPLGTPAPERAVGMTVVVRVAVRIAALLLAVASIYLAAWGYTPGGGFPAGAALMGVVLLLYTGLGHRAVRRVVRPAVVEPVELAGAVAIVVIGVLGLAREGSLFANFVPLAQPMTIRAGGTNQLYSGAELVEVATGLTIAVFSLLGLGRDWLIHDGDDSSYRNAGSESTSGRAREPAGTEGGAKA